MAPVSPDQDPDEFVELLLRRRFYRLGRIYRVPLSEVPAYLDSLVARHLISPEQRDQGLQNLADWRRWGRRNALVVIPVGLCVFVLFGVHAAVTGHPTEFVGSALGAAAVGLGTSTAYSGRKPRA